MRDQFDAGYLRAFAMLADQIADVDDTAGTVMEKRIGDVARRPWDVLIGEDVPDELKDEAKAQQAELKSFFSNLKVRNAIQLNEHGSLRLLLRQLMAAPFVRYAAHEIVWEPGTSGMGATLWCVPLAFLEDTQGTIRYSGVNGITPGQELTPENWLFAVHRRCLMKSLSVLKVLKSLSLSDWVNFSEKFGMPGLHLETNATPGSKEWNEAVEALAQFSREFAIVTSPGQKVNLIEASMSGDGPFAPMVDRCDRAMARVVLGSDLATMSRENGAGASLQSEETDGIITDDCEWLSELLNEQLSRRVIEWRFGAGTQLLAFFKLAGPQRTDTKLEMEVDKHVKEFGVNLSRDDIAERYGRTHVEPVAESPSLPLPESPSLASANEVVPKALVNLRNAQRAALKSGLKKDLKPAQDALLSIEQAGSPAAERAALQAIDPRAIESAVLSTDGTNEALEVMIAAEFLAGLASLGSEAEAANGNPWHDRRGLFTKAPSHGMGDGGGGYEKPSRPVSSYGPEFIPNSFDDATKRRIEAETRAALQWVLFNRKDASEAVLRPDLGEITLVYGWADDPSQKRAGQGIAKIESKHHDMLRQLPELLARGDLGPVYQKGGKRNIRLGDATAVLRLDRDGEKLTWVLNAFDKNEQKKD